MLGVATHFNLHICVWTFEEVLKSYAKRSLEGIYLKHVGESFLYLRRIECITWVVGVNRLVVEECSASLPGGVKKLEARTRRLPDLIAWLQIRF